MRKDYQNLFRLFCISFVLNSVTTFVCLAEERREEKPLEGTASIDTLRSQESSIIPVIRQQPSTTFNYKGFTAKTWNRTDLKSNTPGALDDLSNYTQADYILSYFTSIGILQLGGGYVNYSVAPIVSGTPEPLDFKKIFVSFGLDTFLSPTLTIYKEINNYNYSQWSALLNISHTYEFNKSISLKSSASAGYSKREEMSFIPNYDSRAITMMANYDRFYEGTISISLPITVTESFFISPTFTYAFPFSNDYRQELRGKGIINPLDKGSSFVYGGLSFSFTF